MEFPDNFYIGYISKTRGLKGEVQLFFEFEDYEMLELDVLFLEVDRKLVPFFVENLKLQPNRTAYIFLEDVDHVDKAQALVRKKVYLPNNKRPERHPGDFRITDLKGFVVYDVTYGRLGQIIAIHEYPQQHVATVNYKGNELMFPLNDKLIVSIDAVDSRLNVDLPEGLIDVYSS
ncbi:16S rRNA processing protein RimM [Parapedobacter sp. ISTM3]|uniref:Ribosome maturation factor RimM n=1 Tax=Parapedobacter luteus TaxID=623280 RepID=A0A1T5BTF0_9SPHI|nr:MULTISPECIES: ribosome maturation factor RimM [Parapedobacter]MBK1439777.1 16S rRNA processing protein RimM [Parapedobacter sp. ISTM3]SKB50456.1 16S rRNA processing protein RimM [Parapedobacter luteus]